MAASPSLKHPLYFPLKLLKICGVFTEEKHYQSSKIYYYGIAANALLSGLFTISITIKCLDPLNDFQEFADSAATCLAVSLTTVKSFLLLHNLPLVQKVCNILQDEDFQLRNERQKKTTRKFISTYKALSPLIFVAAITTLVIFSAAPILTGAYRQKLPVSAWFPWDYKTPLIYEIVFLHQVLAIAQIAVVYAGWEPLFATLMGIVSVECQILCDNLRNLRELKENPLDALSICINHHRKILSFSNDIQSLYNVLIFLQFGTSGITICFSLLQLSILGVDNVLFWTFANYLVVTTLELGLYCWYGNEIVDNSLEIPKAAFDCGWEDNSLEFRKNLMFFMMRTQKPLQIYGLNFFVLSLDVFKWVLKTSWSCFTVLRKTNSGT